jgi:hypothetical protein
LIPYWRVVRLDVGEELKAVLCDFVLLGVIWSGHGDYSEADEEVYVISQLVLDTPCFMLMFLVKLHETYERYWFVRV